MYTKMAKSSISKEQNSVLEIWKKYSGNDETNTQETLATMNPVLLRILNQSPCVTWILDVRTQKFSFISENSIDFFGHNSSNYTARGYSFHESIKHPDDILNTWKLIYNIWNVLSVIPLAIRSNYKFSYDYRIIKSDGNVVRILEQNSVMQQDDKGNITHLLGVCNDITQWKRNGTQLASLSSAIDKQHFLFTTDDTAAINPQLILSKRELEILKLMSEGHSSKYIAEKLFISFHTVNTHRQRMIEKTNTKNTGGLVQFGVCNGLI